MNPVVVACVVKTVGTQQCLVGLRFHDGPDGPEMPEQQAIDAAYERGILILDSDAPLVLDLLHSLSVQIICNLMKLGQPV